MVLLDQIGLRDEAAFGSKRDMTGYPRDINAMSGSFFTKADARSGHRLVENFCAVRE